MTVERTDPPEVAPEREMLAAYLDYHRDTLATKCAGLTTEQLKERAVPPSTLSLLGLVRHVADVERGWFQRGLVGQDAPPIYYSRDDPEADFEDLDSAEPDEVFATWREQCRRSREIAASIESMDQVEVRVHDGRSCSLRWILVHMIEEYARHNGHADLLRQRIDGAVGE